MTEAHLRRELCSTLSAVALALSMVAVSPQAAFAQVNGSDGESDTSYSDTDGLSGSAFGSVSVLQGDGPIIDRVDRIAEVCSAVPLQNRIHCFAYQYEALASQLPQTAEYHDMRLAITRAARSLRQLAGANLDPGAPTARVPQIAPQVPPIARRQLPAVRLDTLEQTARAAEAILEETATVLLRSAESTRNRSVAYQRVAAAIDSSKVLLRST